MQFFLILRYSKLEMERLVFILFDFGYAITFGILGIVTLLLNVPKEDGMESYKKARKILGSGLIIMSIYCILRLIYSGLFLETWQGNIHSTIKRSLIL